MVKHRSWVTKLDGFLSVIQLYSYKLPTVKVGNILMDVREKLTLN